MCVYEKGKVWKSGCVRERGGRENVRGKGTESEREGVCERERSD